MPFKVMVKEKGDKRFSTFFGKTFKSESKAKEVAARLKKTYKKPSYSKRKPVIKVVKVKTTKSTSRSSRTGISRFIM